MASKWLLLFLSLELLLFQEISLVRAHTTDHSENVAQQQECLPETTTKTSTSNTSDTCSQGSSAATERSLDAKTVEEEVDDDDDEDEEDDCDEDDEDEDFTTTEASYTPPLNHTFPAPKTAQGLGSDMGEPQDLDPTYSAMIFERVEKAREYMQSKVMVEDLYKQEIRPLCKNQHTACAFWSVLGECENNPGYMHVNCAPVCETCEMLHIDNRCPIDPDAVDTWSHAGHLTKTFERIVTDPAFEQYEPTILSQPPEGPWMIQMENFLSDEEAERLIELGYQQSYERSADVGKKQADGTYSQKVNGGRTSKNAWCIKECYEDPMARLVSERIENVTGIPETNSENLQLLRYEEGEFYNTHNDFIPYQIDRQCGARILTFYMYLNDVEEGGGTNFPELGLTVTPKRGRVAIWPSVLEDNPSAIDDRTKHQALPVIKGVKFGANAWVHQRDYKGPNTHACT